MEFPAILLWPIAGFGLGLAIMLKVYIKPGCPWCVEAADWLTERKYSFEEINVFGDPRDFDRMRQISGQSKAPTLETEDGSVLPDFDVKQLEKFLESHSITPS